MFYISFNPALELLSILQFK